MNDSEIYSAFRPLFDDVAEIDQFNKKKPLLAHYTSLRVLEKILRNDEAWLSNPLFMNDIEEVRFGLGRGLDLVLGSQEISDACRSIDRARSFTQSFDGYFQCFANNDAFDTYVFCLSEHDLDDNDGKLSMWRGYGSNGNGAAIVLDTGQLNAIEGSQLVLAKVHYGSQEERTHSLNGILLKCAQILRGIEIPDDKLYLAAHALFHRIKTFALLSKHRGFEEEREWRIIYMKDLDPNGKLASMLDYWIGPRGIEPKLRLKVAPIEGVTAADLSLEKIVKRIILGPSLSSPLAQTAVLRMLDQLNKSYLKDRVCGSTIPFRAL